MKIIIGLGNKGKQYQNNRHNAGFKMLDLYAEKMGVKFEHKKFNGVYYKGDGFILAKPHTFMNLSGDFVQEISHFYKIDIDDILIVYDDMDMEVGKLRFRDKGSSGGQNGIKDIMLKMNTMDIPRIKIGIGKPESYATNYVLQDFPAKQWDIIESKSKEIFDIFDSFIKDGKDAIKLKG